MTTITTITTATTTTSTTTTTITTTNMAIANTLTLIPPSSSSLSLPVFLGATWDLLLVLVNHHLPLSYRPSPIDGKDIVLVVDGTSVVDS